MPESIVTPVLHYPDVRIAAEWLCLTFGFRERLGIANHRVQLEVGNASVIIARDARKFPACGCSTHSIMVRVADIEAHHEHCTHCDARVVSRPTTYPYGERQYTVLDIGGHAWTFSQTVADIDPATWGGVEIGKNAATTPDAGTSIREPFI